MKNYVSVTGATSLYELDAVSRAFEDSGLAALGTHQLRIGIALKESALWGADANGRYNSSRGAARLVRECADRGVLHYNSEGARPFAEQLRALFEQVEPRTLQINFSAEDQLAFVLDFLRASGSPPVELGGPVSACFAPESLRALDFALIDESGGTGKELCVARALAAHSQVRAASTDAIIGFAGGLSERNVAGVVERLRAKLGFEFSLDAESRLRSDPEHLDAQAVRGYLKATAEALLR